MSNVQVAEKLDSTDLGGYEMFEADCVEGMMKMMAGSVDIVITSPPYNLGIKYNKYTDRQLPAQYLSWCQEWGAQIKRVLKPAGSFFLNVGSAPSAPLLPFEIALFFSKLFILQNTFHWIKAITIETRDDEEISVGHFKPIVSHRFVNDCHEYVFHFSTTGNVPINRLAVGVAYADKSNISRWGHTNGQDKRCRGNTWFIPYKTIQSRQEQRPHPATFPEQLASNCIRLHGITPHTVVLDPFLGIGTCALAAIECQIERFVGFEVDPSYIRIARERVEQSLETRRPCRIDWR